jgi:hypothetical protein
MRLNKLRNLETSIIVCFLPCVTSFIFDSVCQPLTFNPFTLWLQVCTNGQLYAVCLLLNLYHCRWVLSWFYIPPMMITFYASILGSWNAKEFLSSVPRVSFMSVCQTFSPRYIHEISRCKMSLLTFFMANDIVPKSR